MLQYTVHPPPLSLSIRSKNTGNNKDKDKDSSRANDSTTTRFSRLVQRPPPPDALAFCSGGAQPPRRASATATATSDPSSFSSSSTLPSSIFPAPSASKQIPRSPYTNSSQSHPSSRTLDPITFAMNSSSTISTSLRHMNTTLQSDLGGVSSQRSGATSSFLENVLSQGDLVGEGLDLQGESLRLVPGRVSVLDYDEPSKEFEVVRRIGTGSYAVVYLVREVLWRPPISEDGHVSAAGRLDLDDHSIGQQSIEYGREYAIKCLSKANLDEEALTAQLAEATVHQSLPTHPNIVTLHRTLETSAFLLLILEYVPGQDLYYFLEQARDHYETEPSSPSDAAAVASSRTPPTPSLLSTLDRTQLLSPTRLRLIASMFTQMCEAVAACHDVHVFHRDIKPENFIVTDGWTKLPDGSRERRVVVKLTDFGLSTTETESSDMDCGSAPYMAYECRNNCSPTYSPRAADVWSLGIVLINMLYHINPWSDTANGVCNSFDIYRQQPVRFLKERFAGMTQTVAEFLANEVLCILDDSKDDAQRISAHRLGAWVRDLPTLLGEQHQHPGHTRTMSTGSIQGYALSSVPHSRRPSSRQASLTGPPSRRSPLLRGMSLSRAPSLEPAYEVEDSELPPVFDHDPEDQDLDGVESRSISTAKRRKRGARKNKAKDGASVGVAGLDAPDSFAVESLAREISRASRGSQSQLNSPITPSEPSPPPVPPVPRTIAKKQSKWKLSFGKASSVPAEEMPMPIPEVLKDGKVMSTTANNVTNLIMGLNAPPLPHMSRATPAQSSTVDLSDSTRGRGRRPRPAIANAGGPSGLSEDVGIERWANNVDKRSRAESPTSTRSGRPLASSASSVANSTNSSNWRSSTSTMSSSSAFTRYSNSSNRSVSTVATSVSSNSWRNQASTKSAAPSHRPLHADQARPTPPNIKFMTGVPWALDELPRQLHPNPVGDIFGGPPVRKQRMRQPKDLPLDTINERPGASPRSPLSQRHDASTSTTELDGVKDDVDVSGGPKKVQKGQINALAKMLSALRL